jgi:hypothetical protein
MTCYIQNMKVWATSYSKTERLLLKVCRYWDLHSVDMLPLTVGVLIQQVAVTGSILALLALSLSSGVNPPLQPEEMFDRFMHGLCTVHPLYSV